jgi:hypothetical protein
VLTAKTGVAGTTIHAAFYHFEREEDRPDKPPKLVFRSQHPPGSLKGKVLLVDECSMVSRVVAADILATGSRSSRLAIRDSYHPLTAIRSSPKPALH